MFDVKNFSEVVEIPKLRGEYAVGIYYPNFGEPEFYFRTRSRNRVMQIQVGRGNWKHADNGRIEKIRKIYAAV